MIHSYLDDNARLKLNQRIVEVERRTGTQIVLAVIQRSDSYSELPWKAFALGVSIAGLIISVLSQIQQSWASGTEILFATVTVLAAGAACTLFCIYIPSFARLFLDNHRADVEVHQHAAALFLAHELFATKQRAGILFLISLFERRVVVLPDRGLATRLSQSAVQGIIERMTKALATRQVFGAFENGLSALDKVLHVTATRGSDGNELADKIIEEKFP